MVERLEMPGAGNCLEHMYFNETSFCSNRNAVVKEYLKEYTLEHTKPLIIFYEKTENVSRQGGYFWISIKGNMTISIKESKTAKKVFTVNMKILRKRGW